MRTLDEPESPDYLARRQAAWCSRRSQDGVGDIFIVDLATRAITNLTKDAFADSAPTWSPDGQSVVYLARISGNEKLFRLDLDVGPQDAAHVRHARRRRGAVARCRHAGLPLDGHRSVAADRPRRRAQREDLQHLDAQPEDRRAASSTPTPSAATCTTIVLKDGDGHAADRRHQLLQGRLRAAHARAPRSDRHRRVVRLRSARLEHHRLPVAAVAHAGRRQEKEEGHVREDVHRRAPAGERRRHERRRHLRRHGGHLQRRAGRPAVQPLRGVDLAVPHAVAVVSEPRAPLQLCDPGLLADAVLLRQTSRASSTTRAYSGFIDRDLAIATRTVRGGTAFGIWPFNRYRRLEVFGGLLQYNESFNDPILQEYSEEYQQDQFGRPLLPLGHVHSVRRQLRAGDDGVPRVRPALRQHACALSLRSRAEDRQHAVAADRRHRCPLLPAPRRVRAAGAARARCSRAGATRPTSCTSAATPRCAATSTCSSSATTPPSSTPSSASRSSRRC